MTFSVVFHWFSGMLLSDIVRICALRISLRSKYKPAKVVCSQSSAPNRQLDAVLSSFPKENKFAKGMNFCVLRRLNEFQGCLLLELTSERQMLLWRFTVTSITRGFGGTHLTVFDFTPNIKFMSIKIYLDCINCQYLAYIVKFISLAMCNSSLYKTYIYKKGFSA